MTPRRYGETALARSTLLVGLVLAAAGPSCRSIPITPAALRRSPSPAEERDRALEVWREAVALANEFLASPFNRTMPGGAYTLRDEGMRFAWAERDIPVEVRSTTWGDLVVRTGFQAQERAYGFVVGSCPPEEDPPSTTPSFGRGAARSSKPTRSRAWSSTRPPTSSPGRGRSASGTPSPTTSR